MPMNFKTIIMDLIQIKLENITEDLRCMQEEHKAEHRKSLKELLVLQHVIYTNQTSSLSEGGDVFELGITCKESLINLVIERLDLEAAHDS